MENIVHKFTLIIHEYLNHAKQSIPLKTIDNSHYIITIGLNAIIHIFKIVLENTRNVETTYYHCQKAYYCYLEYIEQMNNTNLLHNLNNLDAIIFVYKKTMDDIHNSTTNMLQNSVTNIMSMNNHNHSLLCRETISYTVSNLSIMTKTILFQNSIVKETDREHTSYIYEIAETHLDKFLHLIIYNRELSEKYMFSDLTLYMQYVQEKTKMNHTQYMHYLKELLKTLKKMKKNNALPTEETIRNKYIDIFIKEETITRLNTMIEQNKYSSFVKEVFLFT